MRMAHISLLPVATYDDGPCEKHNFLLNLGTFACSCFVTLEPALPLFSSSNDAIVGRIKLYMYPNSFIGVDWRWTSANARQLYVSPYGSFRGSKFLFYLLTWVEFMPSGSWARAKHMRKKGDEWMIIKNEIIVFTIYSL